MICHLCMCGNPAVDVGYRKAHVESMDADDVIRKGDIICWPDSAWIFAFWSRGKTVRAVAQNGVRVARVVAWCEGGAA